MLEPFVRHAGYVTGHGDRLGRGSNSQDVALLPNLMDRDWDTQRNREGFSWCFEYQCRNELHG